MGHIVNADRDYRLLQQRLDRFITGAPESPTLMRILNLLFSPEEAALAKKLPGQPTSLKILSRKLNLPEEELNGQLTEMAQRGLVIDLEHKGKRYFSLSPVVIGFFEFTFMRTRENLPMRELAHLFEQYMHEEDQFARAVFQGETQIGRTLVREEALPEKDHTEILDWERASHLIQKASSIGLSLCPCRHKKSHIGKACHNSLHTCLSLNYAANSMIRSGMARPISKAEAMSILEECQKAGLAQIGDNVQRKVTYICNCCRCCCGMIHAAKSFNIRSAIMTSRWIMEVDLLRCTGCGQCAKVCPIQAIIIDSKKNEDREGRLKKQLRYGEDQGYKEQERYQNLLKINDQREFDPLRMREKLPKKIKKKWAVRDAALCLGCGVCYSQCRSGAIKLKNRTKRVLTPETIFDRMVSMAIERSKLANLLFDDPGKLSHRALGRVIAIIEKSPLYKVALSIKPLRSAFLKTLVKRAKRNIGELREILE